MTLKELAAEFRELQVKVIAEKWTSPGGGPGGVAVVTRSPAGWTYHGLYYDVSELLRKGKDTGAFDPADKLYDKVKREEGYWVGDFLEYLGDVTKLELIGEAPDGRPLARIADALERYAAKYPGELPAMTPLEQAIFDVLTDEGMLGKDVCAELGRQNIEIVESTLSRLCGKPALAMRGVRNRPGAGYYKVK